jgi:hypothetical protein
MGNVGLETSAKQQHFFTSGNHLEKKLLLKRNSLSDLLIIIKSRLTDKGLFSSAQAIQMRKVYNLPRIL